MKFEIITNRKINIFFHFNQFQLFQIFISLKASEVPKQIIWIDKNSYEKYLGEYKKMIFKL